MITTPIPLYKSFIMTAGSRHTCCTVALKTHHVIRKTASVSLHAFTCPFVNSLVVSPLTILIHTYCDNPSTQAPYNSDTCTTLTVPVYNNSNYSLLFILFAQQQKSTK